MTDATIIQMAGWKRRHAAVLPVVVFNAYVDFWNTVTRAWFDVCIAAHR